MGGNFLLRCSNILLKRVFPLSTRRELCAVARRGMTGWLGGMRSSRLQTFYPGKLFHPDRKFSEIYGLLNVRNLSSEFSSSSSFTRAAFPQRNFLDHSHRDVSVLLIIFQSLRFELISIAQYLKFSQQIARNSLENFPLTTRCSASAWDA